MLLDSPKRPSDARGFVHKRLWGAATGFLGGGVAGAVGGFIQGGGGGSPVVPTGATDFSSTRPTLRPQQFSARPSPRPSGRSSPCPGIWQVQGPGGTCIDLTSLGPGGDPAMVPQALGTGAGPARFDAVTHHPHQPFLDAVTVRRCDRGHVLSWQGLCVSKREIRNSDRMYPKPPRPLGTRSELKAVRVASSFGKRLKKNEKRLQKLGRALGGSSRGRH